MTRTRGIHSKSNTSVHKYMKQPQQTQQLQEKRRKTYSRKKNEKEKYE